MEAQHITKTRYRICIPEKIKQHILHDNYTEQATKLQLVVTSTVQVKIWCHLHFYENFGNCHAILIILSLLISGMNCRGRWNPICHFPSNLLPP